MVIPSNLKYIILGSLVLFASGYYTAKYTVKPDVVTKTEIQTVEVEKKNVVTQQKEIDKPDGSKEIDTTTTDKSSENQIINQDSTTATNNKKPMWHVNVSANKGGIITPETYYQLNVEKRLLGPIFVGVSLSTHKELGLNLGFEF